MSALEDVGGGALLTAVGLTSGAYWFGLVRGGLKRHRAQQLAQDRARQAHAAVIEASLETAWFAPEEIHRTVTEILELAADQWINGDNAAHAPDRPDRPMIDRWARSVVATLGAGVALTREPAVDVLQVINRLGEDEDRVVLRVRLRLRRAHHGLSEPRTVGADLRWTLGRAQGAWMLLSVDTDPLADPVLDRPSIVAAWADNLRLREQSLLELADGDTAGPGADLSELVSSHVPVPQQLVELAQMDGRFAPDLLEARIAHIVEAWEEACTGSPKPLAAVTSPEAFRTLLHPPGPGGERRLMLRDAVVQAWQPTQLAVSAVPPEVEISLTVSAVRYLVSPLTGARVGGSPDTRHELQLRWTLTLTDARPAAWALALSSNPAVSIPGSGSTPR